MPAGFNRFRVPVVCKFGSTSHTEAFPHSSSNCMVYTKVEFLRCSPTPKLREVCYANLQFVPI